MHTGNTTPGNIIYQWRDNNHFELLIDGDVYFPRMLQAIESAEQCVFLEMYLFESGVVATKFVQAFIDAADRGVHIYLLLDDYGCAGLKDYDRQRLHHRHIHIQYYNPVQFPHVKRALLRDHRKILVIDSHSAFIGGTGITDEFSIEVLAERRWRETMVLVHGPCVYDWLDLFEQTWREVGGDKISAPEELVTGWGGMSGRVVCSDTLGRREIKRSYIKRIRSAERTIWVATAYFVPSMKIRRALTQAARKGVDVRLLLPGKHTDHPAIRHAGRRFYYSLLNAGVRIFEYQPRFNHSKVMLCDSWVSIGSTNFDRWNMRWNLEANQEIENTDFVQSVVAMFVHDFTNSRELNLKKWRQIPWYHRFTIWFWGRVDIWVDGLTRGWRK